MVVAPNQQGFGQLTKDEFRALSEFIYQYSGIKMSVAKTSMLEGRLRKRLRATGFATISDYCTYLFEEGGLAEEGANLIDAVTTNKTDFFREPHHFDYLTKHAVPEIVASGVKTLRAWSAACSTGEEPYTLAMTMAEALAAHPLVNFSILATDLSTEVLQAAQMGIYAKELTRPVPAEMQRKYLMSANDPLRGEVRVSPKLRRHIAFGRLNLMDAGYPVGEPMHLIFCRNVLIYFDKPTQHAVISKLCENLVPGGYLFLGHSESINGMGLPLTQLASTVFRKN